MPENLTKQVEVYFNDVPLKSEPYIGQTIDQYKKDRYVFVFTQNDVPSNTHNEFTDYLNKNYGPDSEFKQNSDFAKKQDVTILSFLINKSSGLVTPSTPKLARSIAIESVESANPLAKTLSKTNLAIGGLFVSQPLAQLIEAEFETNNYQVIRKYKN